VLSVVIGADEPLRSVDVARALGLSFSTAGRLIATLESAGFVDRRPDGRYSVGPKLVVPASGRVSLAAVRTLVHPYLVHLRDSTGETAFLVVRAGNGLLVLDAVEGVRELRVVFRTGVVLPIFPRPSGYALLADATVDEVLRIQALSDSHHRLDELGARRILGALAKRGYLVLAHPGAEGTLTLTLPVRRSGAVVAALGVTGPAFRWSRKAMATHLPSMTATAREIGHRLLGFDWDAISAALVEGSALPDA
jgi:DNA-binding IclR family transcriptional regulator